MTRNFAFPSTGDPAQDEKVASAYELHAARMQENICPQWMRNHDVD